MPRAKRAKKSTSSPKPRLQSQPKAVQGKKEEKNQETEETKSQQHKNITPPTSPPRDTSEPFEPPSLLDEEEVPGQSDIDASTKPTTAGAAVPPSRRGGGTGGYNALKSFRGQVYTGMAVGGSHTWEYQPGIWHETKEEPDLWKIDYRATKRRSGRRPAPQGSGAAVGTEYHWFIVAHQYVKKTDANTYETHMTGSKYKLAHRGAEAKSWSVPSVKDQREREVELLEDAGRRVRGLPPVLAGEKVRVEKRENGQQRLDVLFGAGKGGAGEKRAGLEQGQASEGLKRKREDDDDADGADEVVVSEVSEEG
ncbi:hypothetical protein BDBG_06126 [Blastomyces gilchristii SLH14081]|uniref:Uncharacterized protein n=1 Tax=Blastomyces gilchristii (strain SLH14081) TaxID=559298 RepID=A0A179UT13_BLAGS|nr:uncharacterized protein BDBG_06126 [Blastomyces gilchristii SLH14081]OAT11174.1 hypothetical protein BDBG_06126 [Blastomyces gilchristii SLH14081]